MSSLNHVNLEKLEATTEKFKGDLSLAKKVNKVEGEWILDREEGPQFRAEVQIEGGKVTLDADQPTPLGGSGSAPGPMIYCMYGVASCYLATFASIAASENVQLNRLRIVAESHIDLSRSLGLSDNPIVDRVVFKVTCESYAPDEKIEEIKRLSLKRCPAVNCLTNPITLEIEMSK